MTSQASSSTRSRRRSAAPRARATPVPTSPAAARSTARGDLRRGVRHVGRPAGAQEPGRAGPAVRRPADDDARRERSTHDEWSERQRGARHGGSTVPPYEGRRETADVDGSGGEHDGRRQDRRGHRPGAERRRPRAPTRPDTDAVRTPRRPTSSRPPRSRGEPSRPGPTGPAHDPGTPRAEDQP